MRRTARRWRAALVGVAAAGLVAGGVAGCGEVHPGAAATVDGESIPLDEVDELARGVCAAQVAFSAQNQSDLDPHMAVYRNLVLSTLVNDMLAAVAADELGIDVPPAAYERDLSDFEDLFSDLSDEEEAVLREFLAVSGRLDVATRLIGEEVGGDAAADDPRAAESAGQQYLVDAADQADIDLDPRFGELTSGQVVGGSGSLSVPADGAQAEVPVEDLPPAGVCE